MEGEATIFVAVEELDESVAFALASCEVSLVSQVVQDLNRGHKSIAVSVEALEGRVRSEVSDRAKTLASCLESAFTVAHSDQEVLKT